jgi:hypothetical protein
VQALRTELVSAQLAADSSGLTTLLTAHSWPDYDIGRLTAPAR